MICHPELCQEIILPTCIVMDKLEWEIFVDEIENNLFCKPDCDSWSYQMSKTNDYTEKGK